MIRVDWEGDSWELGRVVASSERLNRKVIFKGEGMEVSFEIRGERRGNEQGVLRLRKGGEERIKYLGKNQLKLMRRRLAKGESHIIRVGNVLIKVGPEALGYLFPREPYWVALRLFYRIWELGEKLRRLRR